MLINMSFCYELLASKEDLSCSEKMPSPMSVSVRHIEPKGIGYSEGYTTVEGLFSSGFSFSDSWVYFLDTRLHIFNGGKLASNAGVGVRYVSDSRIFGANTYYDYRNTKHQHYNQVALGLESLGDIWDFRINGYLPVGDKKSSLYKLQFSKFLGNSMYLSKKYEFAMKGANAEIGAHVDRFKNCPLYFAAGPYYLTGGSTTAWGGKGRVAIEPFKYLSLEGNVSYDHAFKWIAQGQVSLKFSFGGKKKVKKRGEGTCSWAQVLATRALQKVDRFEIIPVDKGKKYFEAINPETGLPYFFNFVDNTSNSSGTRKSPYPTLLAAQEASKSYDVIYVFPGDGTSTGMDEGIVLQDGQKLVGDRNSFQFSTSLGNVDVAASAKIAPIISNTGNVSSPAITLASNNVVSGINIVAGEGGLSPILLGDNITNAVIQNNTISAASYGNEDELVAAIRFENSPDLGTVLFENCDVSVNGVPDTTVALFEFIESGENSTINVRSNTITATSSEADEAYSGVMLGIVAYTLGENSQVNIINNIIDISTGDSIEQSSGASSAIYFISNENGFSSSITGNTITVNTGKALNSGFGERADAIQILQNGDDCNIEISNNEIAVIGGDSSPDYFSRGSLAIQLVQNGESLASTISGNAITVQGGSSAESDAGSALGIESAVNDDNHICKISDNVIRVTGGTSSLEEGGRATGIDVSSNRDNAIFVISGNTVIATGGSSVSGDPGSAYGTYEFIFYDMQGRITGNTINIEGGLPLKGIFVSSDTDEYCLYLKDNTVSISNPPVGAFGYSFENDDTGVFLLNMQDNVGTVEKTGDITDTDSTCP
jgi:trimeric autotransporter adhesin